MEMLKANVQFNHTSHHTQLKLLFSSLKISMFHIIERFCLKVSFSGRPRHFLFFCLVSISFVNLLFQICYTLAKDTLHSSATSLAV